MSDLEHDGGKLHYGLQGQGREVLFIHDILGRGAHFDAVIESMENSLRAVIVDLRCHGATKGFEGGWSFGEWVQDVRAICAKVCQNKPLVVGHGLGGAIAATWALQQPDDIDSLILVAPQLRLSDLHREALDGLVQGVEQDGLDPEHVTQFVEAWFSLGWREANREVVDEEIRRIASIQPACFAASIRAYLQAGDLSGRVDDFTCPTRILCGGMDSLAPATLVCPHPPGGVLRMVQDSGHMIPMERPTEIVEEISSMSGLF